MERYGQPTSQVFGLDQFVVREGNRRHELLVDRESALPHEVNTFESGVLTSHSVVTYQPQDGLLVRRGWRTEQRDVLNGARRTTTEFTLSGLALSERGDR